MRLSRTTTTLLAFKQPSALLVLSQLDGLDERLEAQLAYALVLVIVPEEDLIHWELGMGASTDECKDVASEEHLDNADSSIEF
jgi:hypothetical protein